MQKLIKLSDTHYVVVADSKIKEGDWIYITLNSSICQFKNGMGKEWCNKITHSTLIGELSAMLEVGVKELSLSDVEEAVYGYSAEKMVKNYLKSKGLKCNSIAYTPFVDGFNAHKELVKGKLFIDKKDLKPLLNLLDEGYDPYDTYHHLQVKRILRTVESFVESLLPKTEWDCRVVNSKIDLI